MKTTAFVAGCVVVAGVGGIAVQSASATLFDITMALNPVGYWNFETSNLTDHSGNGNDLTLYGNALTIGGGPAVADSTNAGDLAFNTGSDGFYVDTPGGPLGGGGGGNALNWTGNTYTINAWFEFGDTPQDMPYRTRALISKQRLLAWDPGTAIPWDWGMWVEMPLDVDGNPPDFPDVMPENFQLNSYLFHSGVAGTGFGHGTSAGELPVGTLGVGEWHMLSVSANAGDVSYYYDGQLVVNDFNGGNPFAAAGAADGGTPAFSRFWIGTSINPVDGFMGLVDEVSVYTTALSAGEVKSLFTGMPSHPDPLGDFDGDGDVDGDDFLLWQASFGADGGGDADGDGDTDGDDFLIWQANFPFPGPGAESGAVPEPASWALLLVLLGVGAAVRRMKYG